MLSTLLPWSHESITIQVYHMLWHFCNPYLCFPCQVLREFFEGFEVQECRDENHSGSSAVFFTVYLHDTCIFTFILSDRLFLSKHMPGCFEVPRQLNSGNICHRFESSTVSFP